MPVAVCPGSRQGELPKVTETSNTFFPDDRGMIFPEKRQPAVDPDIMPDEEIVVVAL